MALELSKDIVGIQEIVNGEDTHSLNQEAFSLPSRLIAKRYLFRTIFRGSGWSFAHDNDFSHVSSSASYWDNVNEKFYKKYALLDKKHKEWAKNVLNNIPIVGPLGRVWDIKMKRARDGSLEIPWTILSNYPVQGTAADVMSIARVSLKNRLAKLNIPDVKLISSVHDSIVLDCPDRYVQQIVQLLYVVFDDLIMNIYRLFKYDWTTPLACEVKAGPNMRDQEKIART